MSSPQPTKRSRTSLYVVIGLVALFVCCICPLVYALTTGAMRSIGLLPTLTPTYTPTHTPPPSPTATPEPPTPTPPPTDTPTPESPETKARRIVEEALGSGNRDIERITAFAMSEAEIYVAWTINDNLTGNMIVDGAKLDIVDVAEALDKSGLLTGSLRMEGSFPMVDVYGNAEEMIVVKIDLSQETLNKINWDGFDFNKIYIVADTAWVHPGFEEP
jgi:hypothetical protein